VFGLPGATITDTVLKLDPATATRFMDELIADARPGCPAFQSLTNIGVSQTVTPVAVLNLGAPADQSLGGIATIDVGGETAHVAAVVLRRGDVVSMGMILANESVPAEAVQGFAAALSQALDRLQ
jgi:hypothetical protein